MASVNLTIRIDTDDKKTVEKLAKKNDRSLNYIINQAIKTYIEKEKQNIEAN